MALTRITKGVIKPNENYDTHNINSTGIVTAIGLDVNGNGDISGDLNVGGVLTYEDVTSIDSVGIITARQGIHVGAGVSAVGVGTFGGIVSPYADIDDFLDVGSNIQLGNAGVVTATTFKGDGDFVDIDVDGHTNLDNVSVAGVSTFAGNINSANLTISSATPFIRLVDTNPSGQTSYVIKDTNSTLRITDYTNDVDRLTIHGNGSVFVLGNFNASSGIDITGLLTVSGNSDLNGDLDVDGHTNLDHVTIAGIATFQSGSGFDLATNNVSAGMRIINNGNGSSDGMYIGYGNANNGATRLFGGGSTSNPTVINSTGVSIPNDLDVDGHTNLDNVSVAGVTTISNNLTVTSAAPQIFLTDTNANSDYAIVVNTGQFRVRDETNSVNRFYIESDGTSKFAGNVDCLAGIDITGNITATGTVGINETSPSEKLHITVPGNQRQNMLRLQHTGQRNFYIQGQWGSTDIGGSNGILQYTDGGGIGFRSGATGAAGLTLSNGNKVGIHTSDPSVNLHAFMANTTNASLSWGANCGQIFRNEGSELAFGLQNTNPYPFYIQARTSSSSARQLTLNPAGGAVAVGIINSFGRAFQVKGSVGVLSPSQTGALDMSIDDAGNFELGAYHSSGGSVTLKTAPAGLGNQTRLAINKDGQLTHTTNKSSEYTAKFVQAHADNPAWIEIDSPQDNNLRPAYIQLKNGGNNKWGIGQIYNPTAGQSFHITEGTHNQDNSHFVIKSNNYVGINTNNPQSALHVRGAGGIRIDTLSGTPIKSNSNVITDGGGNPIISGTPWFMTHTYVYQGAYSGMRYYWIKIVESQGSSSLGYIEYMAHGDSNYPRATRGTIAIASYSGSSRSLVHDQQTQEAGTIAVRLAGDGTVWMRLANYDWNSDFRFRLVYGESINLNTDFTVGTTSSNSHGRIDTGGGGPVNTSNDVLPGANVRYDISANAFTPSGSNSTYSGDTHRFYNIDVANQLIKGSGSFRIDHPLAGMSTSHFLQHSFVEGPQADNLYRGKTTLVAGISTVNVDIASSMTDGTFVKLNTDVQCFTTNETGWTPIKGTVSGNKLTITAQDNSCTDTISWMVVGERQDDHIKNIADWTDSDGKVIVELPKPNVGYAGTEAPYEEFK